MVSIAPAAFVCRAMRRRCNRTHARWGRALPHSVPPDTKGRRRDKGESERSKRGFASRSLSFRSVSSRPPFPRSAHAVPRLANAVVNTARRPRRSMGGRPERHLGLPRQEGGRPGLSVAHTATLAFVPTLPTALHSAAALQSIAFQAACFKMLFSAPLVPLARFVLALASSATSHCASLPSLFTLLHASKSMH